MSAKLLPTATPETRPFWEACDRGELWIQHCGRCTKSYFYPRPACPSCGLVDAVTWIRCSGRARLYSYVISHLSAPGYEGETPYVIAVVELEEGPRMMTNLVGVAPDPEGLELDIELEVEFEKRGAGAVPVFRLANP
jgi:uncharacterized OB-fold protein